MYLDFVIPFEDARREALRREREAAEAGAEPEANEPHPHHHDEPAVREEYRLESLFGGSFRQAA